MSESLTGRRILITGASAGIGRAAAIELARRGAEIILAGRDPARTEAARAAVAAAAAPGTPAPTTLAVDLGSQASIRAAAAEFTKRYDELHVLLNNAGVWQRKRTVSPDGLEQTFAVNQVAPFLLAELLMPLLRAGAPSRVVTVSSARHQSGVMHWDDLMLEKRYGGIKAYDQSKLAVNLTVREAARRHAGTGVSFYAVHPGAVATEIYRDLPWILKKLAPLVLLTAEKGAQPLVHVASADDPGPSGTYYHRMKQNGGSPAARDDAAAQRVWDITSKLAGLQQSS